jgi:hypothetical protein
MEMLFRWTEWTAGDRFDDATWHLVVSTRWY